MLYYSRIDVSGGIDVKCIKCIKRTNASKECDIFLYCIFQIIVLSWNQMSVIDVMIY